VVVSLFPLSKEDLFASLTIVRLYYGGEIGRLGEGVIGRSEERWGDEEKG